MRRVSASPLFWGLLLVLSAPFLPHFCSFAIIFLALLFIPLDRLRPKSLFYAVTILRSLLLHFFWPKKYPWCQEIIPGKLWLGAIPLVNYNHDLLLSRKIQAVVTIVEEHELQSGLFSEPVSSKRWSELGIKQLHIKSVDFCPIAQADIQSAVSFIYEELSKNRGVYVHCKAGRGRSALIVVAFLLLHGKEFGIEVDTVDDAIAYVKQRRPVINMNKQQIATLENWEN
jgi:protein-tyrosine phosphatase